MRLALELLVLFLRWLLCTTLGTCRPVTTEKLPFQTCGERNRHPECCTQAPLFFPLHVGSASSNVGKRGMGVSSQSAASPHHEGRNNGLLELCFEGVHQLFGFGVVEGENTCGGGRGLRGISDAAFISSFHSSNRLSHAAVVCVSLLHLRLESNYES